jgi:hypothetical protein
MPSPRTAVVLTWQAQRTRMSTGREIEVGYQDGVQAEGQPPLVDGGVLACDRCGEFADLRWSWGRRLCAECLARQHATQSTPRTARVLLMEALKLLPALGMRGVLGTLLPLPFVLVVRALKPPGHRRHAQGRAARSRTRRAARTD